MTSSTMPMRKKKAVSPKELRVEKKLADVIVFNYSKKINK